VIAAEVTLDSPDFRHLGPMIAAAETELAADDLLQGDRRLAGLFAANDLMALGAAKAVKGAGRARRVAVVGVDGIRESLAAIRSGAMSATVAQYPYTIGQLGVQACLAAARAKPIPSRIDAPIQVITRSNVARAGELSEADRAVRQPAGRGLTRAAPARADGAAGADGCRAQFRIPIDLPPWAGGAARPEGATPRRGRRSPPQPSAPPSGWPAATRHA
jgi:Periplasmic binding protein domain